MYKENRTERFEIRLRKDEKDLLVNCANYCDLTPTEYLRTLIWCLKPARLPFKKYSEILETLLEIKKELTEITSEIKIYKSIPLSDLYETSDKVSNICGALYDAIKNPLEPIDPKTVKKLPFKNLRKD